MELGGIGVLVVSSRMAGSRRLMRCHLPAQLVFADLRPGKLVIDADEGIPHLPEVLPSGLEIINRDREDDLLDPGINQGQLHLQGLIVAAGVASRAVIPGGFDAFVRGFRVVVEHKKGGGRHLAIGCGHEGGGVQIIVVRGGAGIRIPSETDADFLETNVNTLTFVRLISILPDI
ncbi:MAG: hypothetical protein JWM59_1579 [Verrucomicrobiales bacterium]|nr:hypothetical protein [Verrucomicrobiales bacterium]